MILKIKQYKNTELSFKINYEIDHFKYKSANQSFY